MIPAGAIEAAAEAVYGHQMDEGVREATTARLRIALEAAAPYMFAPALSLADEWDAVVDVFPKSAAGIFAKSHANRAAGGVERP